MSEPSPSSLDSNHSSSSSSGGSGGHLHNGMAAIKATQQQQQQLLPSPLVHEGVVVNGGSDLDSGHRNGYDDQKLLDLTERTNYNLVQRNGQRIYGGPPPNWVGPPPEKGCEIFVGKVPRDIYEDELVPIFERVSLADFDRSHAIFGSG